MNLFARTRSVLEKAAAPQSPTQPASMQRLPPDPDPSRRIPRLECWSLHSAILPDPETRQISVYLPEVYATDLQRRFPVFYLHDGQNLFDPHTSYIPGRTWRANSTADAVTGDGGCEPMILVGIANTGLRRMAEYTPTRDFRLGGGEGRLYEKLLLEELRPAIDRTYRTLTGAPDTGVGGSSLGGLISLDLALQAPEIFGKVAVISPSLWWDHRSILSLVESCKPAPHPRLWLDIGTAEGQQHVRDTEQLDRLLRQAGWQEGVDLKLLVVPDAIHDEDAWAARFDQVLRFLFPPRA